MLYIYPNTADSYGLGRSKEVIKHLLSLGIKCCCSDELVGRLGIDALTAARVDECECVAAIGGDGTMLAAVHATFGRNIPIFGINTGRMGFLHTFDYDTFFECGLDDLKALKKSGRSLLDVSLKPDFSDAVFALNDAVVARVSHRKSAELILNYGGEYFATLRADGVIVSTPTGSTAYSLSAGGPIVTPSLDCTLITPVCSHSLLSNCVVLSRDTLVEVVVTERPFNDVSLCIDGIYDRVIPAGGSVYIRGSESRIMLLTSEKRGFYEVLKRDFDERT